jgi:phage shock protein C
MTKIYRSRNDVMLSGLCGGIGETYELDPTIVRLGLVFSALMTAVVPVLITYLVAWWIVPVEPWSPHESE